jgi:hypothetical protein
MLQNSGNYDRDYSISRNYDPGGVSKEFEIGEILQHVARFGGAIAGIALMGTGLAFVIKIFGVIATTPNKPGNIRTLVEDWSQLIGNENFTVVFEENEIAIAPVIAVGIRACGGLVLPRFPCSSSRTGPRSFPSRWVSANPSNNCSNS